MNNLAILSSRPLSLPESLNGSVASCCKFDSEGVRLYAATDNVRVAGIKDKTDQFSIELPSPAVILSLHYDEETEALVLVCDDGMVFLLHLKSMRYEIVGDLESTLLCSSGGPDGEVTVCLTSSLNLVALSASWEVLAVVQVDPSDVSPGFQPMLAWQADGLRVALFSQDSSGTRVISVFDRSLMLEARSAPLPNLGDKIAFSPDGELIAATQRIGEGAGTPIQVIFFEPNGLRHFEFQLPKKYWEADVDALTWNADASLLALCLRGAPRSTSAQGGQIFDVVQLWHRSNYRWYLKHEATKLRNLNTDSRLVWIWDEADPLAAIVGVGSAEHKRLQLVWETCVSDSGNSDSGDEALSTLVMVDGAEVQLTPLGKMVVPFPMSAATLNVSDRASPVRFATPGPGGRLALLGSNGFLFVFSPLFSASHFAPNTKCWNQMPRIEGIYDVGEAGNSVLQLTWVTSKMMVAICTTSGGAVLLPIFIPTAQYSTVPRKSCVGEAIQPASPPHRLCGCLCQLADGSVYSLSTGFSADAARRVLQLRLVGILETTCDWIGLLPSSGMVRGVVGRTRRGRLLGLGKAAESYNVTSCLLRNGYLVAITAAGRLLFFPTTSSQEVSALYPASSILQWLVPDPALSRPLDDGRVLERGALLVASPREGFQVFFAAQRGNLEALQPRTLVVDGVKSLLSEGAYLAAVIQMRKHKVDMNLLHDHCPSKFFEDTSKMVEMIGSSHLITLFIASLRDELVNHTLYPSSQSGAQDPFGGSILPDASNTSSSKEAAASHITKTDAVCDALLAALLRKGGSSFLLSEVLTFVKRPEPQVAKALEHLRVSAPSDGERLQEYDALPLEIGLEMLVGMVESRLVWHAALSLYDLELAALGAAIEGQDPRDFLPLIESFTIKPDLRCCFEIDVEMKQYDRAVVHAVQAGPAGWREATDFMVVRDLHVEAIQALRGCEFEGGGHVQRMREAMVMFGERLIQLGQFSDAAVVLGAAGATRAAIDAAQVSGSLPLMLALLHQAKIPSEEIQRRVIQIAALLCASGHAMDAGWVLAEYCNDPDEAVAVLCEAHAWVEAARVARILRRDDLIQSHVMPLMLEAAQAMFIDLIQREVRLRYIFQRLAKLLAAQEETAAAAATSADALLDDAASDAGSVRTASSRATSRSNSSARSSSIRSHKQGRRLRRVPRKGVEWEVEYLLEERVAALPTPAVEAEAVAIVAALMAFSARAGTRAAALDFLRVAARLQEALRALGASRGA